MTRKPRFMSRYRVAVIKPLGNHAVEESRGFDEFRLRGGLVFSLQNPLDGQAAARAILTVAKSGNRGVCAYAFQPICVMACIIDGCDCSMLLSGNCLSVCPSEVW